MFLNIKDANAEISRLTELLGAVEKRAFDAEQSAVTIRQADSELAEKLSGANQRVGELEAQNAMLSSSIAEFEKRENDFAASVDRAASAKALEIVAAQGIKPQRQQSTVAASKTASELWGEYQALQSQSERSAFYKAHRAQLWN